MTRRSREEAQREERNRRRREKRAEARRERERLAREAEAKRLARNARRRELRAERRAAEAEAEARRQERNRRARERRAERRNAAASSGDAFRDRSSADRSPNRGAHDLGEAERRLLKRLEQIQRELDEERATKAELLNRVVEDSRERDRALHEEIGPDQEEHGRPFYLVPVKKTARLPERPHISKIRAWFKKRKHGIMWRNRDSSYTAIVTFYSKTGATRTAWDQLANAADRIPGPAIVFIRYELPIELLKKVKAPNGRYKVKTPFVSADKKGLHWTIDTTPGSRVRVPGDSDYNPNALVKHWEWLLSVIPDERRETRCGLVVMWAPKGGWKGTKTDE